MLLQWLSGIRTHYSVVDFSVVDFSYHLTLLPIWERAAWGFLPTEKRQKFHQIGAGPNQASFFIALMS
jgi:hypothetical protein